MILTIHRGSKQIGGSCVELRADSGKCILLDVGMPLTQPDGSDWPRGTMARPSPELRTEGVLPDIEGLYADSTPRFSALMLSHAHVDHYGLAHHVHPGIPVYGSRGTIAMLRASKLFVPDASLPTDLRHLDFDNDVAVGPFKVRGIPVDHAAPDSRALLVEADGKRVLYSGDLRAHGRSRHLFETLPQKAGVVDVLILEGTTVGQSRGSHGFQDEIDVEKRLYELFARETGLVVVVASGQNIDRAVSVYKAALKAGRELVIDVYQAYVLMVLSEICPDAPQFDSPHVRVKFVHSHVETMEQAGLLNLAQRMAKAAKVKSEGLAAEPQKFVYLARPSGATVALMRYLMRTTHPAVVWSQWSGYLKKGGAFPRFCDTCGIQPVLIHSGGHAHPEDLAALVDRLAPKAVVPIHTETGQRFSQIMPNVRIVNDGDPVSMDSLIRG